MPTLPYRRIAVAACAAAALTLAACANPLQEDQQETEGASSVLLYGTDGTMQNAFAQQLADRTVVAGMKGTRPMPLLPVEFTERLRAVDPSLQDFQFSGETYDAIVISALAAELAGTPDPSVVRTYVKGVTAGGTRCRSVSECMDLARAGEDLAYRGMSLTDGFTDLGQPASATYETAHFGPDGHIDPDRSQFIGAGDVSQVTNEQPPTPQPRPDQPSWQVDPLVFGGLLPATGDLSNSQPPLAAAAQLAIEDVNDAGGVFGTDVEWIDGDSGTDTDTARSVLGSHVAAGVHVIIGPASSEVAAGVMQDTVAAKRIMFSPANTAVDLVRADHDGYYFRTAPPDTLQATAVADVLLRDGLEQILIVARDDSYGTGLQRNVSQSLLDFGVPTSAVSLETYPPPPAGAGGENGAPSIAGVDALASRIVDAEPDGILIIGFSEAAHLIQELLDNGMPLLE